ncbi:MAG: glycosyltransferase family 1 protein [Rhodovarius sp.]|nr:glycosyltransferase family 1 protein [Rhodovarius sp.]
MHAADITDLLSLSRHIRLPSGVTRVQTRLLAAGAQHFTLVAHDPATGRFRRFPRPLFDRLLSAMTQPGGARDPAWQALVEEAWASLAAAPEHRFAPGEWLLGIGAAWWLPGHAGRIQAAREETGLRYASFVYDLIPLTVPEHVAPELVRSFVQHFAALCLLADHAICISEAVRRDFIAWQRRLLPNLSIPADVLRLDARFAAPEAADPPAGTLPAEPFVLAVGSVESRKNQYGLLRAWLHLLRRHGEQAVPRLVLVGIRGYLAEQVEQLLAGAPELARRVEWRRSATDPELAALYRHCLFTIFNSHAEGWGLPVTESIAHGKVPLLPDLPVLREAGGPHAVYVEPECVPALAEAAWRLISNPGERMAREAALRAAPGLRSWEELASACAALLDRAPGAARGDRFTLPIGAAVPGGLPPMPALPALPPAYAAAGPLIRLGPGWAEQEEWGTWAIAPGPAFLRLPLDPALRGQPLTLLLEVTAPGAGHHGRLRAQGGDWQEWRLPGGEGQLRIDVEGPAEGPLLVEIDIGEGVEVPPDHRRLGLGLRRLRLLPRPAQEAGPLPPPPDPPAPAADPASDTPSASPPRAGGLWARLFSLRRGR